MAERILEAIRRAKELALILRYAPDKLPEGKTKVVNTTTEFTQKNPTGFNKLSAIIDREYPKLIVGDAIFHEEPHPQSHALASRVGWISPTKEGTFNVLVSWVIPKNTKIMVSEESIHSALSGSNYEMRKDQDGMHIIKDDKRVGQISFYNDTLRVEVAEDHMEPVIRALYTVHSEEDSTPRKLGPVKRPDSI